MTERVKGDPRELSFYGEGKAESIKRGYAITSLRNPRPQYEFEPGERILADCKDDGEKVPVIVISNVVRKLADQPLPVLAMDGFFGPEIAVKEMKIYPGYENINEDTPIAAIVFVKEESFLKLTEEQQGKLLEGPIEDLVGDTNYRHLFFPTIAFWVTENYGNLLDWAEFLLDNNLITEDEVEKMTAYKYLNSETARRFITENSKALQEISLKPEHGAFKPLILGIN